MADPKRWWSLEMKGTGQRHGQRLYAGRVEATEAELRDAFGHNIEIDAAAGGAYIFGPPRPGYTPQPQLSLDLAA